MNQTDYAAKLVAAAGHITAVTRDNSPDSIWKISDGQFQRIAGLPKDEFRVVYDQCGAKWQEGFRASYMRSMRRYVAEVVQPMLLEIGISNVMRIRRSNQE